MADESNAKKEECSSPSSIRRETRSEGYLLVLDRALYGSSPQREAMRTRSYSTNDSDDLQDERPEYMESRRMSLSEMLLGRRGLHNNQPVVTQTVEEESLSMENMKEVCDGISMSTDSNPEIDTVPEVFDNGGKTVRETTQTDHLNKRLLDSFLSRISSITGTRNPGTVYRGDGDQEKLDQGSGDYSTIYSDDLLMDRIYRRINSKNGKKK